MIKQYAPDLVRVLMSTLTKDPQFAQSAQEYIQRLLQGDQSEVVAGYPSIHAKPYYIKNEHSETSRD